MSPKEIRTISASVLARLLLRAKRTGDDYQNLITAFLCNHVLAPLMTGKLHALDVRSGLHGKFSPR
jgi:hypothetical protein